MKKELFLSFFACLLFSCSTTSYMTTSSDESFEALTKITDEKTNAFNSIGGDNNKDLYFCVKEEDGSCNIYFKEYVLSSIISQKTFGSNFCISPDYCSKNNKLVYSSFLNGQYDIFCIDVAKGRVQTQITSTSDNEYNPCWSSNGKYIVFEKGISPKFVYLKKGNNNYVEYVKLINNQVWLKNIETGELQLIGSGSCPRFSHDNNQIVFVKYELNKSKTQEVGTIWIMDINGENQKQITGANIGYASYPTWSPNDKYIVFQLLKLNEYGRIDFYTTNDIYTINVNGEEVMQHTTNLSNDCLPFWSNDDYIYFTSDRGGIKKNYKIWRFKVKI